MSILEKAYLKAMGQEKAEESLSDNELLGISVGHAGTQRKAARDIVFSRKGISKMSQDFRLSKSQLNAKRLIHSNMKDSELLNRYRNLRTKLLSLGKGENFSILVTSVVDDDDSSLVAANLAAAFALDEAKTSLLVEADIHKHPLNNLFESKDSAGLIDYLEAEDWDGKEVMCSTGIPRLKFVPSGLPRENSAEYFTSDRMQDFVDEINKRYSDRYPIINAPSVMKSADTSILIQLCDKVVLVVPYGRCSEVEIMQAALAIGEDKLAGIILDRF